VALAAAELTAMALADYQALVPVWCATTAVGSPRRPRRAIELARLQYSKDGRSSSRGRRAPGGNLLNLPRWLPTSAR